MFPIVSGVAMGQVAGVSAVSDIYSKDDNGTGATGDGNSKFTKIEGRNITHNQVILDPLEVAAGQAITVGLNGNWTGTAASQAWSITELDNGLGLVASVSVAVNGSAVATTAAFDPQFTISGTGSAGDASIYQFTLAVTNAGGTTTKTWDLIILIP
tara:strand:- start:66 stop:533 length:468 start_codon:yes stop_codon:yes gene_type:complete